MTSLRGKIRHASRQSDLSRWLHDNHHWFAKELKEAGVPNWDLITEMFGNAGLTDKNGNPYNKDAVRIGVDRFFKKFPVKVAPSVPQPSPPSPTPVSPPTVSRETPTEEPDFIAKSKAIRDSRTIK